MNKVAVVGNSGILKNSGHGQHIDSHDVVIRFNRAETKGFEKDVGAKMTIRVVNRVFLEGRKHPYVKGHQRWVEGLRKETIYYLRGTTKNLHRSCRAYQLPWENICAGYRVQYGCGKEPTCGMGMVWWLVRLGVRPTLFGMDTQSRERDHYFEKRHPKPTAHNVPLEQMVFLLMEKSGLVNIVK